MLEGDGEDLRHGRESEVEQATLAHRLDELRWSEPRRGPWAVAPDPWRPPADEADFQLNARRAFEASRSPKRLLGALQPASQLAASAGAAAAEWQRLVRVMDADGTGAVSPDTLVPLMFWLGLARRRSSALTVLALAFGPGDIRTESIRELNTYAEVQARLVEGLRRLVRHESLEQLCEYLVDGDLLKVRTWFYTMKRSPKGHVDIVEVQNLFAREGVTSDRQALFRFLSHLARSGALPVRPGSAGDESKAAVKLGKFGLEDFAAIVCRCIVAWCLHRTIALLATSAQSELSAAAAAALAAPPGAGDAPTAAAIAGLPAAGGAAAGGAAAGAEATEDRELALRWTQLQRKIMVSLLINHRYWGKESRNVLGSLQPAGTTTIGEDLTHEQWQCLFQRVRAQGMAAILPVGDEADDPDFLKRKTRPTDLHRTAPG